MNRSWLILVVSLLLSSITACGSDNSSPTFPISPTSYPSVGTMISLGSSTSGNSYNVASFTITKPGTIRADAIWTGTTGTLALILNGPGQVGYYARTDGPSPLSLSYDVTSADISKGPEWMIHVINFYSGDANGTLVFSFPK